MIRGTIQLEDSYVHISGIYQATKSELEIRDWDIDIVYLNLKVVGSGMIEIPLYRHHQEIISDILRQDLEDEALKDINQQLVFQQEQEAGI